MSVRVGLWVVGVVVVWSALACSGRTPVDAPHLARAPLPPAEPRPYTLKAGDLIAVRFWGNPELDEELLIRPDGRISLPFIDEVHAGGLTPEELDGELTRRYTGELTAPNITVILRQATSEVVFVGGEVGNQGVVELTGPKTLLQVIQEAGGFAPTARRHDVLLIRHTPEGRIARAIDMMPLLSGREPEADIWLQASDIVFVPRTKITNLNQFIDQYIYGLLPIRFGGVSSTNVQ